MVVHPVAFTDAFVLPAVPAAWHLQRVPAASFRHRRVALTCRLRYYRGLPRVLRLPRT